MVTVVAARYLPFTSAFVTVFPPPSIWVNRPPCLDFAFPTTLRTVLDSFPSALTTSNSQLHLLLVQLYAYSTDNERHVRVENFPARNWLASYGIIYVGEIMKTYKYGKGKEQKVARLLRSKKASVKSSPASRGPADLKVTFPTGTKWYVQVKSSRRGEPASPSRRDLGRLKQSSTKGRATPVVAKVSPRSIKFTSARSGRRLTPPSRRRR